MFESLRVFETEWVNISTAQNWLASHISESDEIAKLSNDYPNAAGYLLPIRVPPRERWQWLKAGLDAAQLLDDCEAIARHTGNLGRVYRELGDPRNATECFKKVLKESKRTGNNANELYCLSNLASIYSDTGRQDLAITTLSKALELAQKLGQLSELGNLSGKLATSLSRLEQNLKAIDLYNNQLTIAERLGDLRSEAEAVNNLGVCYFKLMQYPRALDYFERAVGLYESLSDKKNLIVTRNNIGLIYLNTDAYDKALATFELQLRLCRKWEDPYGESLLLYNKAICLNALNRPDEAILNAEAAIEIFRRIGSPELHAAQSAVIQWRKLRNPHPVN